MIDPQVAYDKLSQFETCDDLAKYFESIKIQGYRNRAFRCPIATFMSEYTGKKFGVTPEEIAAEDYDWEENPSGQLFSTTIAMVDFILRFDNGEFPELENQAPLPLMWYIGDCK